MVALNDWLFGLLGARPDLRGAPLLAAVALAQWAVFLGPAMLLALWLSRDGEDRRAAVAAALAGGLGIGAAAIVSSVVFEPRPFMEGLAPNIVGHVRDSGFPSDHATLLFALAFAFRLRPPPIARLLWAAALGLALAVGWARVYLGVHFPLDIAGAAILAGIAAAVVASRWGLIVTERVTALGEASLARLLSAVRRKQPH